MAWAAGRSVERAGWGAAGAGTDRGRVGGLQGSGGGRWVSEYQCYEFVALDRRLTAKEMAELRDISTRAEITPTRFWNEYHWGDLKADPAKLLARYFDVHVHFANWGTRRLMFRLPIGVVDVDALRAYLPGGPAALTAVGEFAVLDLCSEVEEPEEEWWQEGHLAASLPLRAELLRGDLRAAYLAWLLAVQDGEVDPDAWEPPVPRGLGGLSAPTAGAGAPRSRLPERRSLWRLGGGACRRGGSLSSS